VTQLSDLVTPALIVDRGRLLANISEMAARAKALGVALRPRAKTHKSPAIAALQRAHGATGLTVATLTEAEGFADERVDDLLVTAPPVGDWRLERLLALARRVRTAWRSTALESSPHSTSPARGTKPRSASCGRSTAASAGSEPVPVATVTSRPAPGRLILDSGSKALAAERLSTLTPGFGRIEGHPGLRVDRLYEEQAIVHSDGPCEIPVGARLRVVPNHACAAASLHSQMLVVDQDVVVDAWPVATREWREIEAERRPTWSTR
jgi:D-serine deaminase-like pyridoxal phosphate-dependent protein